MQISNRLLKILVCGSFAVGLSACASNTPQHNFNTTNLNDLRQLNQQDTASAFPATSQIRQKALQDTALSVGAQGALALKAKQIDAMLNKKGKYLDRIYNFNGLMLDNNVIPPVLVESESSLNLSSPNMLRISGKTYKIIKQARFVTAPPTWRDYLWMDYSTPEIPNSTLLPRDDNERQLWIKYVNMGWKNGLNQADSIYQINLARLQRDFKGMMLYRKLLASNMVTKPQVVKANMGITTNDNNSEMTINDRVLSISATPELNTNSSQWNPILIHSK